jgi:hypothetical protein
MAFGDFTVTRASTKLRIGSNGLYGSVANNVPAFEFNTDGTYRGLLVEPGATNLALRSQEFDDAYWSKVNLTVTANAGVSPDGSTTADKLIPSTGAGIQQRIDRVSTVTNAVNTWSVYAKNDGYNFLSLRFGSAGAPFNLTTGAIGALGAGITAVSEALPNGWFRVSITGTPALNETVRINVESSLSVGTNLQGDGTSGVLLWQAQLETGSVATSPIVTTAGTASRVADVVSLTGASSLIGQTSGSFFVEFDYTQNTAERRILSVTDGTVTNRLIVWTLNNILYFTANTGTSTVLLNPIPTGTNRVAVNYNISGGNTVIRASVNGGAIVSATQVATPVNLAEFDFGNREDNALSYNGRLRALSVFPTILADATLQAITTP